MSSWNSKKECRSYFKSLCAQEFARGLVQNQQQLSKQLRDFMSQQRGDWGAYRALAQEAGVEEVFKIFHIQWTFPRIKGSDLEFCQVHQFIQGPFFGILEPDTFSVAVDIRKLHGLLIPGVAFNKDGRRLGKGKGFYDKALAEFSGIKVGICFDWQIAEDPLPVEDHDIRMDFLISETGIIDCRPLF